MAAPSLSPGQTLGHFRLIEEIGAGGFGVVYRARDERLERDVALKVLNIKTLSDPSARKHFRREALILSRLNHPNVESVFEFDSENGVDYLVLEYVSGTALNERLEKGALPEKEVLTLGIQMARGLAAAHAQGVLHRDLKPGNLRVTPENVLKILDFGLAQLFASPEAPTLEQAATVTMEVPGRVTGTPAYLAPEQLDGKGPDHRSDIYSAGVVLYELATGSRPFPQKQQLLWDAIRYSSTPAPRTKNQEISPALEAVILKCMEKDPNLRYQSATELLEDLKELARGSSSHRGVVVQAEPGWRFNRRLAWVIICTVLLLVTAGAVWFRLERGARAHAIHSIAIMPFLEASGNPSQDYFADGMTEELISQLTQVSGMRVISHSSVMKYKGTQTSLFDVARQLNVDGIIEGTVYRVENRVRITVELTDAVSGHNVWSRSYERDFGDVLALQAEVARSIVDEVQVKLTPQEQEQLAVRPSPVAGNMYDVYLQGRYYLNRRTPADLKVAVTKFQEAVRQDPDYARAYVGLADAYALLGVYRALSPAQALESARSAAQTALGLDPRLGEAHASLAAIRFSYLEWTGAEEEFKSALQLNPGYAPAHHWYALYLAAQGRFDEALHQIGLAEALDPNSSIIQSNVAWCLYLARRYDEAIAKAKQVLAYDPGFVVAHDYLGQAYLEKGQFESAISELSTAVQLGGGTPFYLAELANAYASVGETEKARSLLRELESEGKEGHVSPADLALVYAGLHNDAKATELLELAVRERSPGALSLKVSPRYDRLRSDPRFAALVKRLGRENAPLEAPTDSAGYLLLRRHFSAVSLPRQGRSLLQKRRQC